MKIDERYAIGEVLGEGAMGRVFAARDRVLGREVAIKIPRASLPPGNCVQRIMHEARASAHFAGEHVARVLDVGTAGPDVAYIVMERLIGFDLDKLVEREGRIAVEQAVAFVRQACDGLAEAHAAGIIHRDVKPSNLFLALKHDGSSVVKVLDFGVAAFGGAAQTACVGTVLYMAPEMIRGGRCDARTDVWSLGVVLHELVAGPPPFRGGNPPQVFTRILTDAPERLDVVVPGTPPELADIVMRCLSKDAASRYASAAELGRALRDVEALLTNEQRARLGSLPGACIDDVRPAATSRLGRWMLGAAMTATCVAAFFMAQARPRHASASSVTAKASLVGAELRSERVVGHVIKPRPPERRPASRRP
jgi:serine/threonine-protein kinase